MDESRFEHEVSAERARVARMRTARLRLPRVAIGAAIVLNVVALGVLFYLVLDVRTKNDSVSRNSESGLDSLRARASNDRALLEGELYELRQKAERERMNRAFER